MADYIHIDNLREYLTQAINNVLDGIADARRPNQFVMNPDKISVDVIVLFSENAVATNQEQTPARVTETITDSPAIVTTNDISETGESTQEDTTNHPSRTTLTSRSGGDSSETNREYEEFED